MKGRTIRMFGAHDGKRRERKHTSFIYRRARHDHEAVYENE